MPTLFEEAVELICTGARELGPSFGWEFLYCPSSLLSKRSLLWFIGINPGGTSKEAVPSFEDGNAYYVDQHWSPDGEVLRKQVKRFFDHLACALDSSRWSGEMLLNETLTANFCPFNSDTWKTFPKGEGRKKKAVNLSRELWGRILRQLSPRVIICMGGIPYREFLRLYQKMDYEFSEERTISTGWGAVNFRLVDCCENGRLTTIAYVPHFSQIKLMLRENSIPHVNRICLAIAELLREPDLTKHHLVS